MKYVCLVTFLSCVVLIPYSQGQVSDDLQIHGQDHQFLGQKVDYDIGILREPVVPDNQGDVLVVLSASWCGPCQAMRPQWVSLRAQGYTVVYIDVDHPMRGNARNEALVKRYRAMYKGRVPVLFWHNTNTNKTVKTKFGRIGIKEVEDSLWKKSSSQDWEPGQ